MARKIIDIGAQGNDGTGDSIREAFRKVNENFTDLYAVIKSETQVISTSLLDDFPNVYQSNAILISDSTGQNILSKRLEALDDSIQIGNTLPDKITFRAKGGKIVIDPSPQLGGHLNGSNFVIANVADPEDYDYWNASHPGLFPISSDDVIITKGYADKRYIQSGSETSSSGTIRIRDEPYSAAVHTKTIGDIPVNNGRLYIPGHGFNLGSNGSAFTYNSTGTFLSPLQEELVAGNFSATRTYKISNLGNTDWNKTAGTEGKTYSLGDLFEAVNTGNTTIPSSQTPTGKANPIYFIRYYDNNYLNVYYKLVEAKEIQNDSLENQYNNRILIIPSSDTICNGTINGTTLGITSITSGTITIGSKVTGQGVTADTIIQNQISGDSGSIGTYTVSKNQNILNTSLIVKSIHTITDAYYNSSLAGYYLANESLPRKNSVRRQGDTMTGELYLSDHPGPLSGSGSPNGPDDLQAATKFYVDNSSFSSNTNLYVSNSGDDKQTNVPLNKRGSALPYAYSSINSACQQAETMIELASNEPGPYRQKIYYTVNGIQYASITSEIAFSGGNSGQTWFFDFKTLMEKNIGWIGAETIAYVNINEPTLVYNQALCARDVELILQAIKLDVINNSNWQSINAGRNYFKNPSAIIASTTQKNSTLNAINRIIELVQIVLENDASPASAFISYQTTYNRYYNELGHTNITSAQITTAIGKINIIKNIINNYAIQGSASHGVIDYGTGSTLLKLLNGGSGADQGISTNIDIIPGKVIRGITSGAIGRILDYIRTAGTDNNGNSVDHIQATLLTPIEFILGEELEFAELNKDLQITIFVESGIYYEDLPIRVPQNVTIKGNDFRRCIVRPKNKTSSSPWVETYFYRDSSFDGLDLLPTYYDASIKLLQDNKEFCKREVVAWIESTYPILYFNKGKCSRDVGLIIDAITHDVKFGGNGESYTAASLYWNGAVSKIGTTYLSTSQITETAAAIDTKLKSLLTTIMQGNNVLALQTSILQSSYSATAVEKGKKYKILTLGNNPAFTTFGAVNNIVSIEFIANANGSGTGTVRLVSETDGRTKVEGLCDDIADVIKNGLGNLATSFGNYDSPKYGYHYLANSLKPLNLGASYSNVGSYNNAAYMISINKAFLQEETKLFIKTLTSLSSDQETQVVRNSGFIIDSLVTDLKEGGRANIIDIAARFYNTNLVTSWFKQGVQYIITLSNAILSNPNSNISTVGADNVNVAKKRNTTIAQLLNSVITIESGATTSVTNLIGSVTYALDIANYLGNTPYNPPKNSNTIDVFLFNDAVRVSNITGQGHGGFMCVLDPSGSIGSKSPYVQESASFCASINKQAFRGGMFIDGFSGRLIAKIIDVSSGGLLLTLEGLIKRRPIAPTAFYYNGFRYQIDNIISWNPTGTGQAIVELNATTPWSNGNLQIILETPGNRSMLANDYTQINDLAYGIIAHNAGLTEQVSTFTYYCHTAYYASNGGQIRSVAGSNANGNFGLRASGADPTELPDQVALSFNQNQPLKIFRYGDFSNENLENSIIVYAKRYSYTPESISELEIEHVDGDSSRYEVRSITKTGLTDSQYKYRITAIDLSDTSVKVKFDSFGIGASGLSIENISRTDPCEVKTFSAHGLVTGDFISIWGITGMTQLNGGSYYVKVRSPTTFQIYKDSLNAPVDSTLYTTYLNGGAIYIGLKFYAGDVLTFDGLINSVQLNRKKFLISPTSTFNQAALYTDNISDTTTSLTAGKLYTIADVGSTNWNTQAGTTNKTYVIGSTFIAASGVTLNSGSVTYNNSFRGSIEGTTLTVTKIYFGTLAVGQYLIGPGVSKGTKITQGNGLSWTVNLSQSVVACDIIFYRELSNAGITAFGEGTGTHNVGLFVTNRQYMITETGSFTDIGSSNNTLLNHFVATGSGTTGTNGTAYYGGWAYEKSKYRITDISSTSPAIVTFDKPIHLENSDIITISGVLSIPAMNNSHYVRKGGSIIVSAGNFIPGENYKIVVVGNTPWATLGATLQENSFLGVIFTATGPGNNTTSGKAQLITPLGPTQIALYSNSTLVTPVSLVSRVRAGNFVSGKQYKIVEVGTTDFRLLGASSNTVGIIFTATGSGNPNTTGEAILQAFTENSTNLSATNIMKGSLYKIISANDDLTVLGASTTPTSGEIFEAVSNGSVLNGSNSTVQLLPSGFGGKEILQLSLSTNAADNRSATGITTQIPDHSNAVIRILQNMRFNNIENVSPTRPSTALEIDAYAQHASQSTLRVIAYNLTTSTGDQLPDNLAILTTDQTFNYVKPNSKASALTNGYGSTAGDTKIAVDTITTSYIIDLLNTGTLQFSWAGKLHRITGYVDAEEESSAYIIVADVFDNNNIPGTSGLREAIPSDGTRTFRSGLPAGSAGAITIKISTCRATGHDFLDIGTGGFNTTNYPTAIYGNPSIAPSDAYEIKEETKGRVFYVTSDQDGVFKVGPYFKVDQGTGTVTFAASIALSNLDGLGFKRGVTISEFSTDNTMTNNAADTVPTQQAVRGYIDKRLGIDHNGTNVPVANKIGPGYMPLNGQVPMQANLTMSSNYITGLGTPGDVNTDYAATVGYVLGKLTQLDEYEELTDVVVRYGETLTQIGSSSSTIITVSAGNDTGPLSIDMPVRILTAVGNLRANVTYYVLSKTPTTFTLGTEKRGEAINVGTTSSLTINVYKDITGQIVTLAGANNAVVYTDVKGDIYSKYTADGITTLRLSIGTDTDSTIAQNLVASGVDVYDVSGFVDSLQIYGQSFGIAPKNYFQINGEIFSFTGVDSVPILPEYPNAGKLTGVTRAQRQSKTQSHNTEDRVIPLNSARLDFQISADAIVNADVNPNAGILQSKLSMNAATTRENATNIIQADRGLASFDSSTFTATNGWISITNSKITYAKIQNVDAGSLLGNLGPTAAIISHITPEAALKRAMWNYFNTGSTDNTTYAFTFNKQGTEGNENNFLTKNLITTTGENSALVKTNGTGGIVVNHIKTNSYQNSTGSILLSANGTTVTYGGSWSAGADATLRATTADIWHTSRTITLSGDVTGSVSINGGSDVTITTTIAANSLTLGTDTTGQFASTVAVSGTGLSCTSPNADDGTAYTITSNATSANTANAIVSRNENGNFSAGTISATFSGNLSGTSIQCTTLTTGGATTAGTITGAWTLSENSKLQATYADLAEYYTSDQEYEPGTVLVFGGIAETTVTKTFGDSRVAGVVTTNPAYTMNVGLEGTRVCVALQGRVPCKVVGKVRKGDLLTTSAIVGHAAKSVNPQVGTIIGKALEDKDYDQAGVIEIAVGRV